MIKTLVTYIAPCDMDVLWAFLLGQIPYENFTKTTSLPKITSKKWDVIDDRFYKKYKDMMTTQYINDAYIHSFDMYYRRYLSRNGDKAVPTIIPAHFAPIETIKFWVQRILRMDKKYVQKVELLKTTPYQSIRQLQGKIESHYRIFADYQYVYINNIQIIYICYINNI